MLVLVAALAMSAQPAQLHLLPQHLVLAQAPIAPPPPVMPNEPPPPAPFAPPPDAAPPSRAVTPAVPLVLEPAPPRDLHLVDMSKGSFAGGEFALGIVGALGVTLATTFTAVGVLANCTGSCSDGTTTSGILLWFLSWYVLEPFVVSGIEVLIGMTPHAGTYAKSVGFGFAAEGIGLVGALILAFVSPTASAVFLLAVQLVGVPLAGSLGLHSGDEAPGPDDPMPATLDAVPRMSPGR